MSKVIILLFRKPYEKFGIYQNRLFTLFIIYYHDLASASDIAFWCGEEILTTMRFVKYILGSVYEGLWYATSLVDKQPESK